MPKFTRQASEQQFQVAVIELARLCGWWVYHTWDSRHSEFGWPDLVLIRRDRVLFRELKAGKRQLTRAQAGVLDLLSGAGQDAGVWRSPEDWPRIEVELGARDSPALARRRVADAVALGEAETTLSGVALESARRRATRIPG